MSRGRRLALFLASLVLMAQAFALPSAVRDAGSQVAATGFMLQYSTSYLLLGPFCGLADMMTILGAKSSLIFLVYLFLIIFLVGGSKKGAGATLVFLIFLAWGVLAPRPMARLIAADPDLLLVDFHSHTQRSHDGRKSFSPHANRLWHMHQGFGAAFITDHNQVDGALEAKEASQKDWKNTGYASLAGEEVSLLRTHLVVLGVKERIDNQPYDSDTEKVFSFIRDMRKKGYLVIASLPEYWLHHWHELHRFVEAGISGFEIVNSAPKALDFRRDKTNHMLLLASNNNLFVTGISDTHGYGGATAVWNAVRVPGWQKMDPRTREVALLSALRNSGFQGVQVIERIRFQPDTLLQFLFSPMMSLWLYWRTLTCWMAISWVIWLGVWALGARNKNGT